MGFIRGSCKLVAVACLLQMALSTPAMAAHRVWDRHSHRFIMVDGAYHYGPAGEVILGEAIGAAVLGAPVTYGTYGDYDPYFSAGYTFYDEGGYRYYRDHGGRVLGRVSAGAVRHERLHR